MQDGDDPERHLLLWCVRDQIFADPNESERAGSQIRPAVTLMRQRNQPGNLPQKFCYHAIGGIKIVRTDELPDFVQIELRLRVERVSGHEPDFKRRAAALLSRK